MELLQNLKEHGAKLCVATSKPEPMAKSVLDHLKVTPFLDYMAGADLNERHSNKTELIEKASSSLQYKTQSCRNDRRYPL